MTTNPGERSTSSGPARDNLQQLILLRTIAVAGQAVTVAFAYGVLDIPLPLLPLAVAIAFLALFNLAALVRLRVKRPVSHGELFAQISVDVAVFTTVLYLTGGAHNPFAGFYLLLLTVAAVMLPWGFTWALAGITAGCYLFLLFFNVPLTFANGQPVHEYPDLVSVAVIVSYAITAALIAYFVVRITGALREHERLLAQARENELNSERIVQLGTFAAGAAHELGTPLSTMAVVVKELQERWPRMPELQQDLRIISDQIKLCKGTLSNLVSSAGHMRMNGGGKLALDEFLQAVVHDCRVMRPKVAVSYHWDGTLPAPEIVAEQTLRQAILNLLNNAADASPERIDVEASWNEQELCIRIRDQGLGIPSGAADKIGKIFFTTKSPGEGSGVGMVLSRTIIGRFGGSVRLFNQPERGACTEVRLPLSPLMVSVRS